MVLRQNLVMAYVHHHLRPPQIDDSTPVATIKNIRPHTAASIAWPHTLSLHRQHYWARYGTNPLNMSVHQRQCGKCTSRTVMAECISQIRDFMRWHDTLREELLCDHVPGEGNCPHVLTIYFPLMATRVRNATSQAYPKDYYSVLRRSCTR